MRRRIGLAGICLGVCGILFYGQASGQETVVTNLVVEGYLAVEGAMEQDGSIASGVQSTALGQNTEASGVNSLAQGFNTVAAGEASHAGGAFARVRPEDSNAFIHATGMSTNNMKETRFPYAAHFDHIVTLSPALSDDASVLSRAENDIRYLKQSGGSILGPLTLQNSVSSAQYLNSDNEILGQYSLAIGGLLNMADEYSVVAGGWSNAAIRSSGSWGSSGYAFVGGGRNNTASGFSAISGGAENQADWVSAIGGGCRNAANNWSFVGAGCENQAAAWLSSVVGGRSNSISDLAQMSFIGGGERNCLGGYGYSVIGGGLDNTINSTNRGPGIVAYSIIGGGCQNTISRRFASIVGGHENVVRGIYGTVSGGRSNLVEGAYGVAGGFGAQALHEGTWVWADAQGESFASIVPNEFAVRAEGGVRLEARLRVNGEAQFSGPILIQPAGDLSMGSFTNGLPQ